MFFSFCINKYNLMKVYIDWEELIETTNWIWTSTQVFKSWDLKQKVEETFLLFKATMFYVKCQIWVYEKAHHGLACILFRNYIFKI